MNPAEALQYLSTVAADYARTLPPSAQGPTVQAINQALAALDPLTRAKAGEGEPSPLLRAVPVEG